MNELAELRQRISELETSESEYKQTEEKYRSLVPNIPDAAALLNKKRV